MVPTKVCKKLAKAYLNRLDRESIIELMTELEDLSGLNGQYRRVCRELKIYLSNERKYLEDAEKTNV